VVYAIITDADKNSRIHFLTGTVVVSGGFYVALAVLKFFLTS
jgi:hypothetical protein